MALRTVALTFDDGPGPHTAQMLAILADYDVRCTFFVTGDHVRASPELAARIAAGGHLIGNHTFSHPQAVPGSQPLGHFDLLPADVQAGQIDDTTAQIVEAAGIWPRYFRGPGGRHFSDLTGELVRVRGLAVAHWTADTGDWNSPAELCASFQDSMLAEVRAALAAGLTGAPQMVLMHDAKASAEPETDVPSFRGNTVAVLPRMIELIRAAGFAFADPAGNLL